MAELARSVDDLLRAVAEGTEPKAMRRLVEGVLHGFEHAKTPARNAAVRALGKALVGARGKAADVLALALGALVESGGSPAVAWTALSPGLPELFTHATSFARRTLRHAKEDDVARAIEKSGSVVAKRYPNEAEAWNAAPARALAAVACVTRSAEIRAGASGLLEAALPLSDVMEPVFDLIRALRLLTQATLLVVAPEHARAFRLVADGITTNAELSVLVADAIAKPLGAKRPAARALKAMRTGSVAVDLPFRFLSVAAVGRDGAIDPDAALDPEASPADLPDGVLLVVPETHRVVAESPFTAVDPSVRVDAELAPTDVVRVMLAVAQRGAKATESAPKRARGKKRRAGVRTRA